MRPCSLATWLQSCDPCFCMSFLVKQNAATSASSNCKVGTKAVWLLYLGAKWQTNFGPYVKDKPNICQFQVGLYLGTQLQREEQMQHQDEARDGHSWLCLVPARRVLRGTPHSSKDTWAWYDGHQYMGQGWHDSWWAGLSVAKKDLRSLYIFTKYREGVSKKHDSFIIAHIHSRLPTAKLHKVWCHWFADGRFSLLFSSLATAHRVFSHPLFV